MLKFLLLLLFASILAAMLAVTIYASLDRSVFAVGSRLTSDPWFQATLADAYFGFITFYVWVAYQETTAGKRALWFLLIMGLGNIAMAIYLILKLRAWDPRSGAKGLLLRPEPLRSHV